MNEVKLIQQCKKGDGNAFRNLIEPYRRKLTGYLFLILKEKLTVEDTFQEVLMKVWKNITKYDEQQKFSSWLFSIAHNSAIDALRKSNLHKLEEFSEELYKTPSVYNPSKIAEAKETVSLIYKVVDTLPDKQKQVFFLRQQNGLSFKEISAILGQPLNTVLSHMRYAVQKIKKDLKENNEYKRVN